MIPLSEINKAAKHYGVPAETLEKDYMICWLLVCFARCKLKKDFVFYGGTAIKRIYFEDHRFSEDVDLISTKILNQDFILKQLSDAFKT
ncbi:MAG: nucleotidyl transferase AbiEii/AbiGii toxin family protein [Gammaproteobacteria bacterium]|nr:nucleotidyl transferase AbiEii/AbiGii toxin family protein [Gammaproteobacteria bacterium]